MENKIYGYARVSTQSQVIERQINNIKAIDPNAIIFTEKATGTKLDIRTAQEQIQRYNKSRGVNKTSVHLFRHTFATMYLKNGGDIYRLQKLLGHSSIKITEKYLHYTTAELQRDYNKLNPLDRLTFKIK